MKRFSRQFFVLTLGAIIAILGLTQLSQQAYASPDPCETVCFLCDPVCFCGVAPTNKQCTYQGQGTTCQGWYNNICNP